MKSKYWEWAGRETVGNQSFEGFLSRYPATTMVLCSEELLTPLVAIQILGSPEQSPGIVIERHDDVRGSDFHLLTDRAGPFSIVITNLWNDDMLKVDLMLPDRQYLPTVNPGPGEGLNQVNELRPRESYRVRCDQRDDLELALVPDASGQTLAGAEKCASAAKSLARYDIYVTPAISSSSATENEKRRRLFSAVRWSRVESVLLPGPPERPRPPPSHSATRHGFRSSLLDEDEEDMAMNFSFSTESMERGCAPGSMALSKGVSSKGLGESSLMRNALASRIGNTGRQIQVSSAATDRDYLYDCHTPRCRLGFSVSSVPLPNFNAQRLAARDARVAELNSLFAVHREKLHSQYLTNVKIFRSDCCVLCLESTPELDCLLLPCGHLCVHEKPCSVECLKSSSNCPLCRASILFTLPAAFLPSQ